MTFAAFAIPAVGAAASSLRTVDRGNAVAAGSMLVLAAVTLRDAPPARTRLRRPAFAMGVGLVVVVFLSLKALCSLTPYCVDEPVLWTA
jgi:hypothetical protein